MIYLRIKILFKNSVQFLIFLFFYLYFKTYYGEIKPITNQNQDEFYNLTSINNKNPEWFENNWGYILQATRAKGFIFKHNNSAVYFWFRNFNELVIVNFIGPEIEYILSQLKNICAKLNIKIVIKNVPELIIKEFQNEGFVIKNSPWSKFSVMDDNSYPQITSNVLGIINLENNSIRRTYKYNIKKFEKNRKIEIILYDDSFKSEIEKILLINAWYLESKGADSAVEVYNAHTFFFKNNIKFSYRLVFKENGKIIGAAFFTVKNKVAYWNALINYNESNLMNYLIWISLKYINNLEPLTKLSLQGCENQGQYNWKQGYYPLNSIKKVHMEFNPSN
jgi:hypothetical protein